MSPSPEAPGLWEDRLRRELDALDAAEERAREGTRTVELDQQAVGRLSRMDALQSQAMSLAGRELRARRRRALQAALRRLQEGDYGYCIECGDEIPARRLEIDPAAMLCVSCAGSR